MSERINNSHSNIISQPTWKEKWQRARNCLKTIYRGSRQPNALQMHGTKLDQEKPRSSYLNEVIGVPLKLLTGESGIAHIEAGEMDPFMDEWEGASTSSVRPNIGESFHDFMLRRGVTAGEKCRLQKHRITYYSAKEREDLQVTFKNGKLFVKGALLPTGMYMFALDAKAEKLYVAERKQGLKHSSFLAGAATRAAGYVSMDSDGSLFKVRFDSGHYRPTSDNQWELYGFLCHEDRLGGSARAVMYESSNHF